MNKMLEIGSRYVGLGDSGKHYLMDYYNKNCISLVKPSRRYAMKYSDDWCAMFVSVLAFEAGLKQNQFPYEVSVFYMCEIAKSWGKYSTNIDELEKGDLIIYDWSSNGTYDHVGIVADDMGAYIKVLEGNYKNTVAYRVLDRNSRAVKGLIKLDRVAPTLEQERLQALVKLVLKGHFGDGEDRAKALGSDYLTVQKMVNKLLK